MGFARGNNVGYSYAKQNGADYIAILNNDIMVETKQLLSIIDKCFFKYGFSILGSDIISLVDRGHQNPADITTTDLRILRRRINRYRFLRVLNNSCLYDVLKLKFGNESGKTNKKTKKNVILKILNFMVRLLCSLLLL